MMDFKAPRIRRRTLLGGGISAGLASLFLRPLEAFASNGPPTRVLIIHCPCGTVPNQYFPVNATPTAFTLAPIVQPLAPLQSNMVFFDNVTNSRDGSWQGDRHGQGMIAFVTGSRAITDGTPLTSDDQFHNITGSDKSIEQLLLSQSPLLQGSPLGSIALGAYRDSVQNGRIYPANGAANFRPITYLGANQPVFPEVRPDVAVQNLFSSAVPGGSAAIARQQQLNKSILDLVAKDITNLQKQVPSSQRPKLDAHLSAIQTLETEITALNAAPTCTAPTIAPQITMVPAGSDSSLRIDAVEHTLVSQEQLNTIKVAFQCDLIRAATFTFAHGNSDIQFGYITPTEVASMTGAHDISHLTDPTSITWQAAIHQYYCQRVADFLTDLKNTPDGPGTSLLDNTLVVFFTEVTIGNIHSWTQTPVIFFGGKSVGLQTGRYMDMKGRYMNDIWASTLAAFGVPLPSNNMFGGYDVWAGVTGPRLGMGAVSGIFGST
jgi:hypothetical protein